MHWEFFFAAPGSGKTLIEASVAFQAFYLHPDVNTVSLCGKRT